MIPEKLLNDLQAGDSDPYYKTQEIDYSEPANGYYYQTSFFESFIKKLEKGPIPGSRDGHHIDPWGRPGNDVYLIGAKLDKKNKKVYFKNYFPLKGETGTVDQQEAFILAAKMNTVHFSLVSYTKDKIILNEQGEIERIEVIESVKGERNDAVEYGLGAMKQKTNAAGRQLNRAGVSNARARIAAGNANTTSSWSFSAADGNKLLGPDGDDWENYGKWHLAVNTSASEETKDRYSYPFGKNNQVYRSALIAIRQRASAENDTSIFESAGSLIDEIDKKSEKSKEVYIMPADQLKEILENVKNNLDNGNVSKKNLAKALGLELVSDEHRNAVNAVKALEKITGSTDLEKTVQDMVRDKENVKKENFLILRNKLMTDAFGDESTKKKANLKRDAAEPHVTRNVCDEQALKDQIEKAKENSAVKFFAQQEADETSELNDMSGIIPGDKKNTDTEYSGDYVQI